jgi:ABC-type microcin C transport system permease subunit YejE
MPVLILVLVEVAPRVQITNFLKLNDMVLILVLVEVAPRDTFEITD